MLEFSLTAAVIAASPAASEQVQFNSNATASSLNCDINLRFDPASIAFTMLSEQDDAAAPAPELEAARTAPPFGSADSWRWMVQAGAGSDFNDSNLVLAGAGLSYFLADDISVDFEINLMHFSQEEEDAVGINFALLFRWHFFNNEARTWSLYLDGGAGMLATSNDVPADGSSFNFTPQAGVGVSFDLGEASRMLVGVRWHHVSNANTYEENPGVDSAVAYAQLSLPF